MAEQLAERVPRDAAYSAEVIEELAAEYLWWARMTGIRADLLWAQALLETNGLRFTGQVKPWQLNFCGIKTADSKDFASFSHYRNGVIAHAIHMAWYAYDNHLPIPECSRAYDPRHFHHEGKPHHGGVTVVGDLGNGNWTGSPDYASKIVRVWNRGI